MSFDFGPKLNGELGSYGVLPYVAKQDMTFGRITRRDFIKLCAAFCLLPPVQAEQPPPVVAGWLGGPDCYEYTEADSYATIDFNKVGYVLIQLEGIEPDYLADFKESLSGAFDTCQKTYIPIISKDR